MAGKQETQIDPEDDDEDMEAEYLSEESTGDIEKDPFASCCSGPATSFGDPDCFERVINKLPDYNFDDASTGGGDWETLNEGDPGEGSSKRTSNCSSDVVNDSKSDLFACILIVYKREFKGQTSGAYVGSTMGNICEQQRTIRDKGMELS